MTILEKRIFNFNKRLFGEEYAANFFNFCSTAFAALVYLLYLLTLPLQFVYYFCKNFIRRRRNCVNNR